jgi:hypothetical protein
VIRLSPDDAVWARRVHEILCGEPCKSRPPLTAIILGSVEGKLNGRETVIGLFPVRIMSTLPLNGLSDEPVDEKIKTLAILSQYI